MDLHQKIAAWLRLLTSGALLLGLSLALLVGWLVSQTGGAALSPEWELHKLRQYFTAIVWGVLIFLWLLALAEVAIAVLFLVGVQWARYGLVACAVLSLINIPLGTALGAYTLWAMLRSVPPAPLNAGRI